MKPKISIEKIYQFLCQLAPLDLAEDWDNVGLQVGSLKDPANHILVSLDVTESVLWEAVEHQANLIITHHPLFFRAIRCLDDRSISSRLARLAVQMDINILSFHTNLDATRQGLNDLLAKQLGLTKTQPLIQNSKNQSNRVGLGRIGHFKKSPLSDLIKKISQKLPCPNLKYVGNLRQPIQKVAVMTGSGGEYFLEAKKAQADVLVTGDVKYHQALDAQAEGLAIVDIGHFAGEIGMVAFIAKKLQIWLKKNKFSLQVFETQTQTDPFNFWPR